jgi:hypothetical protein
MVNFRFHVVSIIAIFLAIAIGTVMGATFVGRGVIDNLQGRIDRVQHNADLEHEENARISSDNENQAKYIEETQGYAVGRSLAGVTVNMVAERGVDGATVDRQAQLLRQAGATVPGVVWLEESWKLNETSELTAMRQATGLSNRAPTPLRTSAAGLLGRRLAAAAPAPGADDLLVNLVDAKFVTLSGVAGSQTPTAADFSGVSTRSLVLGGPASAVPVDTTPALAAGMVDGGALLAVGEIFTTGGEVTERDEWIDALAGDDALRNHVSTIDDVDRVEGRVAATLALAEIATGTFGNYGLGREHTVPQNVLTTPLSR